MSKGVEFQAKQENCQKISKESANNFGRKMAKLDLKEYAVDLF